MIAKLRHIFAVLCGAAIIFASCSSGGGSSGGGSSTNASLAFSEDVTVTDSANTLSVSDVVPYSEKSFGVYVKDGVPSDITVVSDSAEISVSATEFSEAADSALGEYLSTVTYALNGFEDVSAVITVTVGIDGSDTLVGKINLSAEVADAVDSYKVSNLVQTLDKIDSNPTSDHNVSLSWTLPEDVSVSKLFYRVVQTSEDGEEVSDSDAYDSGIIELAGDAVSLTTSGSIPSSSEFTVYIYTLTADGWSVSSAEGVKTAADTTPPVTPSVIAGDNSYGTVYLVYTKASDDEDGTSDDTYSLKITIPEGASLVTSDTVKLVDETTDTVLVNSVNAGESLAIPFTVEHKNTAQDYSFSVVAYDKAGNAHTDTEGTSAVEVISSSVADTVAPEEVTEVVLDLASASKTLSWSYDEFSDDDFDCVKVYVDGSSTASKTVAAGEESTVTFDAAPSSSVKITACDTVGNESEGITVTVAAPVLSGEVSTGYTGQLVVSDVSLDSAYTWTAEASDDSQRAVYDSDSAKLYVSGLAVGTSVNPSAVFIAASSDYTVKYLVAAENAGTPTMTVWKLANSFTNNSYYLAFDLTEDRTYANGVIATASEITEHGCLYDRFIVWPGLASGTTDISLELSNSKAEESGYFVMTDSTVTSTDSSWWRTNSWVSGCNEYTLFAVQKDNLSSNAAATYIISDSAYGDDYILLNWAKDTSRYVRGFCYHAVTIVPGTSTISDTATEAVTGADYAWIPTVYTWTGSEAEDAPTSIDISATETSDHSITFSWADPSDADFDYLTVTTGGKQADGTTDVTVPEKIESGVQTVTFSKLAAETEYSFTFTLYDVFGNSTVVNASGTTSADSEAPSAVTELSAAAGRSSVTLNWTASASDDVKEYKVYVDDAAEASVTVTGTTASVSDLSAGTEYSFAVKAVDYSGNESEAVSVSATPAIPSASNVAAEARYTGSVLVTWTDTTAQEEGLTYSYKVTCSDDSVEAVTVESGVQQAHFTGLTVGNNYSFTVTVVDSDSVECGSLDTESVTAKTVIWQILSGYGSDRYLAWAASSSSTVCYNTAAVETSANPTAYLWIVRPSLSGTDGYFSLEAAADESGVGTGYFLYYDTNSRPYVAYNGTWGSGNGVPYAMVATLHGAENNGTSYITDNAQASFKLGTSSYGSAWSKIVCEKDDYYIQHASLTYSMIPSSTSEDGAGCGAFKISSTYTADVDYYADGAPDAVTDLTSTDVSTTSVTLTYTEPGNADLSFVRISYTLESGTASTVDIAAGSNGTTLTGLTKGVTYTITATAYDVYGNASSATDELTVSTLSLTNIPTNVAATARFTGEILVTWDRAEDDTSSSWQYKVVCSDDGVDEQSFTSLTSYAGTYANESAGVAQFTGLTSGTSYTFTVYASEDGENWNNDGTVSATAVTVSKKIYSLLNPNSNDSNRYLNFPSAGNNLNWQYTTGGGNAIWYVYPAIDGTITVSHSITNSSDEVVTADYDSFSLMHASLAKYLYLQGLSSLGDGESVTSSSTYVASSADTSSFTDEQKQFATFFMGYNSNDGYYALRANYSNWTIGMATSNGSFPITNNATATTAESTTYAWKFID